MISVPTKPWIVSLSFIISIICIVGIQALTQGVPLPMAIMLIVYNVMAVYNQWVQSIQSLPSSSPGGSSSKTPVSLSSLWKLVKSLFTKGRVLLVIITVFGLPTLIDTALVFPPQASACQVYPEWQVGWVVPAYFHYYFPINQNAIHANMQQAKGQGQECIGISDGSFRLDGPQSQTLHFGDDPNMASAAQAYRAGNGKAWSNAQGRTQQDAEPLIYIQDQSAKSAPNYYDIVVVTMLSGDDQGVDIGRDELRGFYQALSEYNDNAFNTGGMPIRFLIANIGGESGFASQVEQQIETLASQDNHLIAILGWPISGNGDQNTDPVIKAVHDLTSTGLPVISPTATVDQLSQQLNPYFFRVTPMNEIQAEVGAQLVETAFQRAHNGQNIKQQTINVAVLTTNDSFYSTNLSQDFKSVVQQSYPNIHLIPTPGYNQNNTGQIISDINNLVSQHPDIIYLPGYSEDAQTVLEELDAKDPGPNPHIEVVGGDGLSYTKEYPYLEIPSQAKSRLYYTSFSLPPSNCKNNQGDFYAHYDGTFNICPNSDSVLAYDAAKTMFYAIQNISTTGDIHAIRNNLLEILLEINATIPGVVTDNGHVSFQHGERTDALSMVYSLFVDQNGEIHSLS